MEWDKEARERFERMPIPPNFSIFARKQTEEITRNKEMNCVSIKEVREAEELYADYFGRQKSREMINMLEGKEPVPKMVEELFFDPFATLYNIQVCPVKYGSQCREVTEDIVYIFRGMNAIFEKENFEEIIAHLSKIPLGPSSSFNIIIDGCSNCCEPPFLMDLGIVGQHIPEITEVECLHCNKCVSVCYENAITIKEDHPFINREQCINCEFCAKTCPCGKIVVGKRGYKIIVGGRSYRHPIIATTLNAFADKEEVLATVKKVVNLLRKGKRGDSLNSLIEKHGINTLQ